MPTLTIILGQFAANPTSTAKTLRDWLEGDPATYCHELVEVVRGMKDGPGCRHLLWLISGSKVLTRLLCDPSLLSEEEAASLIEILRKTEPSAELNVFEEVFGLHCTAGLSLEEPDFGLRFLQVFSPNGNNLRLLPMVARLLKHPNAKIRSKAAVMMGKMSRQYEWLEHTRNESDKRVRANALEALWEPGIPDELRAQLWEAAGDENNRVVGNALLGLYRQGESSCIPLITAMTRHPEEKFRATAAWVIRETRDERFREHVVPLLEDASSMVKRNAEQAIEKIDEARLSPLEALQLSILSRERGTRAWKTPLGNAAEKRLDEQAEISGSHIVRVAVVSQQTNPLSTLVPTDFRITLQSKAVERYEVSSEALPRAIGIAFALPAADAARNSIRNTWRTFFSQFSRQKRTPDDWTFVEYGEEGPRGAGDNLICLRNSLPLDNFLRAPMHSRRSIQFEESFDLLLTPPPSLCNGVRRQQGALHVIVVESNVSCRFEQQRLESIKERACAGAFTIHTIASNSDSVLAELSAATRGVFMVSKANVECWQRALLTLYALLFSIYRIEFEAAPTGSPDEAEFEIQVQKGPFFGEIKGACTPQPELALMGQ